MEILSVGKCLNGNRMSEPGWRLSLIAVLIQPGCSDEDVVLEGSGLTTDEDAVKQVYVGLWGSDKTVPRSLVSSTPLLQQFFLSIHTEECMTSDD